MNTKYFHIGPSTFIYNLTVVQLNFCCSVRTSEAAQTYLADELYVRGAPVKRLWKNIKIKSLGDISAEKKNNKKLFVRELKLLAVYNNNLYMLSRSWIP